MNLYKEDDQFATLHLDTAWVDSAVVRLHRSLLTGRRFSRPQGSSHSSSVLANGAPISSWLDGSNANADYTVINHSRIHPDYMVTFHQNLSSLLVYPISGRAAPEVAIWNAGGVYDALVDLRFTSGASYEGTDVPIAAPGGTIYKPGGADLYFPQGNDWGTMRRANSLLADVMAGAFGLDASASVPALTWEACHAQYVLDQQARSTDGRAYVGTGEDTYSGREEAVAFLWRRRGGSSGLRITISLFVPPSESRS